MVELKSYAAKTDKGPYLQINEDNVDVDFFNNLYMIFDGFGGASVGDKAVFFVMDTIKKFYTRISGDPDATLPFYYSPKYLIEGNALINAMEYAHFLLKKENREKEMDRRGGTSCIAVSQAENLLTLASTGNCLGLFYSMGYLKVVSAPDNFENLFGGLGHREFSTAPSSGFGLFDDLHLRVCELRIQEGDRLILLSDGVYGRMGIGEFRDFLESGKREATDKIDKLFELANDRGNRDNQSMIVLNF